MVDAYYQQEVLMELHKQVPEITPPQPTLEKAAEDAPDVKRVETQ